MEELINDQGRLFYKEKFLNSTEKLFEVLKKETPWRQDEIFLFGQWRAIPRMHAWYGDEGTEYTYSHLKLSPLPWTETLKDLKQKVEQETGHSFNCALVNLYRHGQDSNGWHSDNEKELGINPCIASLSLGETRKFHLKRRGQKKIEKQIDLLDGSLVVMEGEFQHHWLHCIPKTKRIISERINITFRLIN